MTLNKTLVYWSHRLSNHDLRLIRTLTPFFTKVHINEIPADSANIDNFIAGPLTVEIPNQLQRRLVGVPRYFITWGYDLNEDIEDLKMHRQALNNLQTATMVVVDSKQSESILKKVLNLTTIKRLKSLRTTIKPTIPTKELAWNS